MSSSKYHHITDYSHTDLENLWVRSVFIVEVTKVLS
uniref:Uncharacterized protein n=1 Tax=Parascaris equorum TaxID=6256 RepID=A0A914RZK8_PAREQ